MYAASKHAVEAIAESMKDELQEFGVEVATMNPGPFLTGFNDRIFNTWESWEDDPQQRLFDYSKLAFPRAQFNPEPVYATLTALAAGEIDSYRNLEPTSMIEETKSLIEAPWDKKTTDGLGTRNQGIQNVLRHGARAAARRPRPHPGPLTAVSPPAPPAAQRRRGRRIAPRARPAPPPAPPIV